MVVGGIRKSSLRLDRFAIRAEIHRRGGTLTAIARNAGLSDAACRVALAKPCPSGERAIARYLRKPMHELWPDRYDERGRRRPSADAKNSITRREG